MSPHEFSPGRPGRESVPGFIQKLVFAGRARLLPSRIPSKERLSGSFALPPHRGCRHFRTKRNIVSRRVAVMAHWFPRIVTRLGPLNKTIHIAGPQPLYLELQGMHTLSADKRLSSRFSHRSARGVPAKQSARFLSIARSWSRIESTCPSTTCLRIRATKSPHEFSPDESVA